jgi:hypothetical protein
MASKLKTYTFSAPSHWACYLINGDCSGMEDDDIARCDEWLDGLNLGAPVDVQEVGFVNFTDARISGDINYACDAAEYTFLK